MQTFYYIFKIEKHCNLSYVHKEEVGVASLSAFNYFSFWLHFF